jgi:hypothetical protein
VINKTDVPLQKSLSNDCEKLPATNKKYCRRLVQYFVNPNHNKIGTCKVVGLCPATYEIEEPSVNLNELDYANEGYMNAETCQSCVDLVDVMKNKEVQVNDPLN